MVTRFEAVRDCLHRDTYWHGREESKNGKGDIYEWRPGHGAPSTHMEALDPIPEECQRLMDARDEGVKRSRAKARQEASTAERILLDKVAQLEAELAAQARPATTKQKKTGAVDPLT